MTKEEIVALAAEHGYSYSEENMLTNPVVFVATLTPDTKVFERQDGSYGMREKFAIGWAADGLPETSAACRQHLAYALGEP